MQTIFHVLRHQDIQNPDSLHKVKIRTNFFLFYFLYGVKCSKCTGFQVKLLISKNWTHQNQKTQTKEGVGFWKLLCATYFFQTHQGLIEKKIILILKTIG